MSAKNQKTLLDDHIVTELAEIANEDRDLIRTLLDDNRGIYASQGYYGEIVHDLNNVLASTSLTLKEMLRKQAIKSLPATTQKSLGKLTDKVQHSLDVIELYMDEISEKDHHVNSNNINEIINQVIRILKVRLEDANIEIDLSGLRMNLPDALVNRTDIVIVFYNLVNNAYDALLKVNRPRRLSIEAYQSAKNEHCIEIIISDNGCGIKYENRKKIFHSHFSTKDKNSGGLGMFIIRRLLIKNHGKISFQTHYSRGTSFSIALPIA